MSSKSRQERKQQAYLKEREEGFDLDFGVRAKVPEYNALRDPNMRHYFECEAIQGHLLNTGQIDQFGRIIHLEKHRSRLRVIENEFRRAERLQEQYKREEAEARYMIRQDRFRDIEKRRRLENVEQRKVQKRMQLELVKAEREILGHAHLYYGSKRCDEQSSGQSNKREDDSHHSNHSTPGFSGRSFGSFVSVSSSEMSRSSNASTAGANPGRQL